MMRFGCGAHMMGSHGGHRRHGAKDDAAHARPSPRRKGHVLHSAAGAVRTISHPAARGADRRQREGRHADGARDPRSAPGTPAMPQRGRVAAISTTDGFGFIDTDEPRLYFDRASVLDDAFDELTLGAGVAFVEQQSDNGPQASTVQMLGGRHSLAS